MVEDLAVAEFVPANTTVKTPYFDGSELGVSFVRTAIGPSSRPGLEIVRFQEVADSSGPALVRSRAAFVPMDANAQVRLADPVVLIRSPYRVTFAYAGSDDTWQPTWRNAVELPKRVRITVRDGITQQQTRGVDGGAGAYRHARRMRAREERQPVPDADRARHGGSRQSNAGRCNHAALIRICS